MTINDEIIAIANQLANNGQKPSVALIKTKLSAPTPLPQIISVLKNWVHQPNLTLIEHKATDDITPPITKNDEISLAIQAAIAPLQQEIKALRAAIEVLSKKLT